MDRESIIVAIDEEVRRLASARAVLSQAADTTDAVAAPAPQKRRLSKAIRARMAEGQRKRWAAAKKAAQPAPAKAAAAPTKTLKLNAAARKRIAAAQKKRWAAIKAAKKAGKKAPVKMAA